MTIANEEEEEKTNVGINILLYILLLNPKGNTTNEREAKVFGRPMLCPETIRSLFVKIKT